MSKLKRNLEQMRAQNALEASLGKKFKGTNDGEVVKKVPTMIRENGLLGALAFAMEAKEDKKEKAGIKLTNPGHNDVFRAIIRHLADVGIIEHEVDMRTFVENLCESDATHLRAVTSEAMAYLNYLRRFASKGGKEEQDAKSES